MKYDMLKELLEDKDISSLTLYLVNNKELKVSECDKDKSDDTYLYVTEPSAGIVSLKYVVYIGINFSIDYDALIENRNFGF